MRKLVSTAGVTLALGLGAFALTACGSTTAPAPAVVTVQAPPAAPAAPRATTPTVTRQYTGLLLDGSLTGLKAQDGTSVVTADCSDEAVDQAGVGAYSCALTYSDGVQVTKTVTLAADGSFTSD